MTLIAEAERLPNILLACSSVNSIALIVSTNSEERYVPGPALACMSSRSMRNVPGNGGGVVETMVAGFESSLGSSPEASHSGLTLSALANSTVFLEPEAAPEVNFHMLDCDIPTDSARDACVNPAVFIASDNLSAKELFVISNTPKVVKNVAHTNR